MKPFTILCDTCASRLKVKARSAIGQRLACPKCGAMVEVVAPKDWVDEPSNPVEQGLSPAGPGEQASSETDFEDIEHVLATGADPPDSTTRHRQRREKVLVQSSGSAPQSGAEAAESMGHTPLLPNERWTAPATLRRRKLVSLVAAIIGLLVLAITVVLAISANQSKTTAVSESGNNAAADTLADKPDSEPETDLPPVEPFIAPPADQAGDVLADDVSKSADNPPDSDPMISNSPPPGVPPDFSEQQNQSSVVVPDVPSNISPFADNPDQLPANSAAESDSDQSGFNELAQVLASSGSSLFEINRLAELSERRRVGLRKYFVRQPEAIDPKNLDRLDDPVAGIQFSGQSLLRGIAEITLITGVPISLDADILRASGFDFGQKIDDLKMTDTTFRAVIEAVLAKQANHGKTARFVLEQDGDSAALISADNRNSVESISLAFPDSVAGDQRRMDQFVELIKSLIAPQTWNAENGQYSLAGADEQIQVSHKPIVLNQFAEFLEKWNIAMEIQAGTAEPAALNSRWKASAEKRAATIQSTGRLDVPIEIFLAGLDGQAGVNLLINWNLLVAEGWNPNTMVPGDLDEATVAEVLDELTHSMDVAWRVVQEDTFEITSAQFVDQTAGLEFYSCGKVLSGPLNAGQLVDLIGQSLQSSSRNSNDSRFHLDATTQCLIVVAPPAVHRQIEAVISRLEKLD